MNNITENIEEIEEKIIGATESKLLQAMCVDDNEPKAGTIEPPVYIAYAGKKLEDTSIKASINDIVQSVRTVYDPEVPINVYDMGLIYKINQQENGEVFVDMTLTSPTCPIAGILPQQVADAIASTDGVGQVEVRIVWEPAWTPDKMTDEGKEMLELI